MLKIPESLQKHHQMHNIILKPLMALTLLLRSIGQFCLVFQLPVIILCKNPSFAAYGTIFFMSKYAFQHLPVSTHEVLNFLALKSLPLLINKWQWLLFVTNLIQFYFRIFNSHICFMKVLCLSFQNHHL